MAKIKLLAYLSLAMMLGFVQKAQADPTNAPGAPNLDASDIVLNVWSDAFSDSMPINGDGAWNVNLWYNVSAASNPSIGGRTMLQANFTGNEGNMADYNRWGRNLSSSKYLYVSSYSESANHIKLEFMNEGSNGTLASVEFDVAIGWNTQQVAVSNLPNSIYGIKMIGSNAGTVWFSDILFSTKEAAEEETGHYVYFTGTTNNWTNAEQRLESINDDGIYTGFVYIADGTEFKFQREKDNWDTQINSGNFYGRINGDFTYANSDWNLKANAGEGVYYVTLQLTGDWSITGTKINNMNLVGGFNSWEPADNNMQMTWNADDYCFEFTSNDPITTEWKFTANNSWDVINLGGSINELVAGGANLTASGNTIKLYPTRRDSGKIYCTVENEEDNSMHAPDEPTTDPDRVLYSLFGDYYPQNSGATWDDQSSWAASIEQIDIEGYKVLRVDYSDGRTFYPCYNAWGADLSGAGKLYASVWSDDDRQVTFSINGEGNSKTYTADVTGGQWNYLVFEVADLTNSLQNFNFTSSIGSGSLYFADVYFTIATMDYPESPDPDIDRKDVTPIYSTVLGSYDPANLPSVWGMGRGVLDIDTNNSVMKNYSNSAYFDFEVENMDASGNDRLHIDLYSESGETVTVKVIDSSDNSYEATITCTAGEWTVSDIELTNIGNVNLASISKVEINRSTTNTLLVDNVYFYRSARDGAVPASTDETDITVNNGIDWNTDTGTTDMVFRVLDPASDVDNIGQLQIGPSSTYPPSSAYDKLVGSYYGNADVKDGHQYVVVQLWKSIEVSDVEIVWGSGFAKNYDVYVTDEWPIENMGVKESVLTNSNLLYSHNNLNISDSPYWETTSNLSGKSGRYLVLDLKEMGNSTFGYLIQEIHVGERTEDYEVLDHVGIDNIVTLTNEIEEDVIICGYNKRGAKLENVTFADADATITCDDELIKIEKNSNNCFNIYGTGVGVFTLHVGHGSNQGSDAKITVHRNWERNSLVQGHDADNYTASQYEDTGKVQYSPDKAGDGKEAEDLNSRYSSLSGASGSHDPNQNNQWWMVDLEKAYSIIDMEIIWENAYAQEYEVYGFETEPTAEEIAALTVDSKHFIYKKIFNDYSEGSTVDTPGTETNLEGAEALPGQFPYHDVSTTTGEEPNMVATQQNHARYLLIKLNTPSVSAANQSWGFSFWEVYAFGYEVEEFEKVTWLEAPDIIMPVEKKRETTVTAKGEETVTDGEGNETTTTFEIPNFRPVDFQVIDPETGQADPDVTTTKTYGEKGEAIFIISKRVPVLDENGRVQYDGEGNVILTDEPVEIARIIDNTDGTYEIKSGKYENDYTFDSEGNKVYEPYTVKMTGENGKDEIMPGTFLLTITKEKVPMQLDIARSDLPEHQVYDDGYYYEPNLLKNATTDVLTIDLRSVDFTTDNKGNDLSKSVVPTPADIKENGKQLMNPNVIYYTDEKDVTGGNVAVQEGIGENLKWKIADLEIWDGWNYGPFTEGVTEAQHARYYTSIPKDYQSFIVLPFQPRMSDLTNRGIQLFEPSAFQIDEENNGIVELTEVTEMSSDMIGRPYIIYTENGSNFKKGGYAVVFHNEGYVGKNSTENQPLVVCTEPGEDKTWKDAETGATIQGTFVRKSFPEDDREGIYFYSISQEKFMPVGDEAFTVENYNGQVVEDYSILQPFYAWLTVPAVKQQSAPMRPKAARFQVVMRNPGDVNGDGMISVSDVTTIVDKILGTTPPNFVKTNADMTGEGKITVGDVTEIVDKLLGE